MAIPTSESWPLMAGAEPFHLEGSTDVACVLVHGFTGSPFEMRSLGEKLAEDGITCDGPLLTGHGTRPEALANVDYRHWVADVEQAVERQFAARRRVFLVGLSMGGSLALHAAARRAGDPRILGVVPICAPLRLVDWRLAFLPVASLVIRWSSWGKPDIKDERQWDRHVAYKRFHVRGVTQLLSLLRETRGMLEKITQPILVVQSSSDHTVQPSDARVIYERVSSEQRELLWLDDCYHVVTLDFEAERLQAEVRRFILTHSGL